MRKSARKNMNKYHEIELLLSHFARVEGLEFLTEYTFASPRRWRFDYALLPKTPSLSLSYQHSLVPLKIAVEIEGGIWQRGRHNRASGFLKDIEKYNTASSLGWFLFRATSHQATDSPTEVIELIERLVNRVRGKACD